MFKKMLLLTILGFSLAVGSFWALKAQDPAPQKPATEASTMRPQAQTTQTDLSGTYTGTFKCEGLGLMGETTLTINGNEFTTADGKTGRIVASTTGGYTAVALQVNAADPNTPPQIVSLRAHKSGSRLILSPTAGTAAGQRCSFVPGRAVARGRRKQTTPPATGTEVTNPAAVPSASPTESPMPSPSPAESPMPSQTPSPSPTPTATPEPMPSPTPSGSPAPMPSPSPGEPTPSPTPGEPTPSPSASPTPTPSPSPSPTVRPQ